MTSSDEIPPRKLETTAGPTFTEIDFLAQLMQAQSCIEEGFFMAVRWHALRPDLRAAWREKALNAYQEWAAAERATMTEKGR